MRRFGEFLSIRRIGGVLALVGALQGPVHAQEIVTRVQDLGPSGEEILPPGAQFYLSPLLGGAIATDGQTALIQEIAYTHPDDPNPNHTGRVAVFTRNSAGTWERNGSIDEPADLTNYPATTFGTVVAVSGDTALAYGVRGMYVFHRQQGNWKRVQTFRLQDGWAFADAAIDADFAFLAVRKGNQGVVYGYRVTSAGRLEYLQRLDSGVDFDSYARSLSLSGDHLVVSATDDDAGRGAAYVFERRGQRWKKQQKLVAIDGVSGTSFGADVAISGDWIAIGAPGVDHGPSATTCPDARTTGSVYVFRNTNGTWSEQQEVTALDSQVLYGPFYCVHGFGQQLVASGKWIVAISFEAGEGVPSVDPWVFHRDAGRYDVAALAPSTTGGVVNMAMTGNTLFLGMPNESGCYYEFCPGRVDVDRLNDPAP